MNQSPKNPSFRQDLLSKGVFAALTLGCLLAPSWRVPVQAAMEDSPKAVIDEVWQIVNNEFVDKNFNQVDWQKTRQELLSRNYASQQEAYQAIRQALKRLDDHYTRFLDPKEFESLTSQTSGEVSGVGIRFKLDEQTHELTVVEPLENSPASQAGIRTGDKILRINGKPTSLMTIEQASEEIRGKVGTRVSLEISRPGRKGIFQVTLTRAQIELPSLSYTIKDESQMRVGYIKLDEFSSHAAEQMKQAIKDLNDKQASAFVLDLRGNPGGLLLASVDIARMWMDKGAIVQTVDRKGGDRRFSANGTSLTDRPLVVLVDENSASASEILAAALQENKRATLVGTRTFGKGTVQSVHSLTDGSGLAVTIARYYPPDGVSINKKGVAPDISQELTIEDQFRLRSNPSLFATVADPQYAKAIAVLKTIHLGQTNPSRQPISIR